MLAHCKHLPAWAIWECMWNERGKAAVTTVKSRGYIKASTLFARELDCETSIAGKLVRHLVSGVTSDNPMTFSPRVQFSIVTERASLQAVLSQLANLIA